MRALHRHRTGVSSVSVPDDLEYLVLTERKSKRGSPPTGQQDSRTTGLKFVAT